MATIAMILAGGEGTRLTVLSEKRAKPAVPFAGKFRIIDFTLSNCVNSGIYNVGVLTQYRPHSLNEHIGIGRPWDLDRTRGGVRLLQPYQGRGQQTWYAGTADAIHQNLNFIRERDGDPVLVLSGDHIYKMDYRPMLEFHRQKGADLTIAVMPVPMEEAHRFGILELDEEQAVVQFLEKPEEPPSNLASMGIYIFNTEILERRLEEESPENPRTDFGKHVVPAMLAAGDRVYAYRFEGYWVDVGTIDAYWATNLALLQPQPELDLYSDKWPLHTRSEERPPVKMGPQALVHRSMVSNGCVIRGTVENSVLSPGVYVSPGAVVRDSIVMNDTWIGPGAVLERAVVDKQVSIGSGAQIGMGDASIPNALLPDKLNGGFVVIGKGASIPDRAHIGTNVLINSDRQESNFPADGLVPDGGTV
ncbi:MAG: glucose-1-phosphate adenylyltransferase [Caldilineae bacterium]|nr:MAG: glucose-1-phosphate adenylyltransferase [Caldilineae bacterium]